MPVTAQMLKASTPMRRSRRPKSYWGFFRRTLHIPTTTLDRAQRPSQSEPGARARAHAKREMRDERLHLNLDPCHSTMSMTMSHLTNTLDTFDYNLTFAPLLTGVSGLGGSRRGRPARRSRASLRGLATGRASFSVFCVMCRCSDFGFSQ